MVGARSTAQPRTAMFLGAVTVMLPAANDFYGRGCRVSRLASGWRLRLAPALAGRPWSWRPASVWLTAGPRPGGAARARRCRRSLWLGWPPPWRGGRHHPGRVRGNTGGWPPPWRGGPFWVDILYPLHGVDGAGFSRPWGLSSSSPAFPLPVPTQPLFTPQVVHHSAVPVVCLAAAVDTICHPAVCLETCEVEWMELEGNSNGGTSTAFLKQLREGRPGPLNVVWETPRRTAARRCGSACGRQDWGSGW